MAEEVGIEPDLLQQCGLANRPGTLPLFFQIYFVPGEGIEPPLADSKSAVRTVERTR